MEYETRFTSRKMHARWQGEKLAGRLSAQVGRHVVIRVVFGGRGISAARFTAVVHGDAALAQFALEVEAVGVEALADLRRVLPLLARQNVKKCLQLRRFKVVPLKATKLNFETSQLLI